MLDCTPYIFLKQPIFLIENCFSDEKDNRFLFFRDVIPSKINLEYIHVDTIDFTKQKCVSGGGTSPIKTNFLDHRYLETADVDFDVYWCDRQLSQINILQWNV